MKDRNEFMKKVSDQLERDFMGKKDEIEMRKKELQEKNISPDNIYKDEKYIKLMKEAAKIGLDLGKVCNERMQILERSFGNQSSLIKKSNPDYINLETQRGDVHKQVTSMMNATGMTADMFEKSKSYLQAPPRPETSPHSPQKPQPTINSNRKFVFEEDEKKQEQEQSSTPRPGGR